MSVKDATMTARSVKSAKAFEAPFSTDAIVAPYTTINAIFATWLRATS
jgi:hypothetical protein